jgi:fimbrial protein
MFICLVGRCVFREVIADACEVQAGDRTLTVSMGQVSSNRFHRVGEDTDPVPFHIQLLNCNTNVSRYVAIQFRGVGDGKQPDVLSIGEGPGIATNVGVALFDRQGAYSRQQSGANNPAETTGGTRDA